MKYVVGLTAFVGLLAGIVGYSVSQDNPAPKAPDKFKVKLETSKGDVVIEVTRELAPVGADRFHEAVKAGFYDECRFFRVIPGFMVQFGINGDPKVQSKWRDAMIKDDPVKLSNKRGFITYAKSARPNSRTTQVFINFKDNAFLDGQGFAPFGQIVEGMDIVDKINAKHRENPQQGQIQTEGNAYLKAEFPDLDFIKKATILKD